MHRDQAAIGVVGEVAALRGGGCADNVHDLGRLVAACVVGVYEQELLNLDASELTAERPGGVHTQDRFDC